MKTPHALSALTLAMLLSACGGGGDDVDAQAPQANQAVPDQQALAVTPSGRALLFSYAVPTNAKIIVVPLSRKRVCLSLFKAFCTRTNESRMTSQMVVLVSADASDASKSASDNCTWLVSICTASRDAQSPNGPCPSAREYNRTSCPHLVRNLKYPA